MAAHTQIPEEHRESEGRKRTRSPLPSQQHQEEEARKYEVCDKY